MVAGIQEVWPDIKFVGLALGTPNADYNSSFLNTANQKPDIPLALIGYHF
jgi:hypothetical protein